MDISTTRDGLVDEVPSFHLALCGLHHALAPLVHSPNKGIFLLLRCERDRVHLHNLLDSDRLKVESSVESLWLENHIVVATLLELHAEA